MMKTFIKTLILFLAPIFLVWGALEYFYRTSESNYSYKHRIATERYDTIETLILGDSHAFFGINPICLETKAINLSNISQSLYFDELLFRKHVINMSKLKNVIITIGYYSLSQQKNTKEDVWRKYFYKNQMQLTVPIVSPFDLKQYSLSTTRRLDKSMTLLHKYINEGTIIGCDPNGWGNYYKGSSGELLHEQSARTAIRHEDFLTDFTENIDRLQSIIEYCQGIGCNVYLIDMPVHKTYVEALNSEKIQKITESCEKLEKHNKNVHYLNLQSDRRLEDVDLYDPDHLNHRGAQKYSKIVNGFIQGFKNDK